MKEIQFQPFPELLTKRLLLRRITIADAKEILFLRSDETVLQYIEKKRAASLKEAEDFIILINNNIDTNDAIMWGITLKENPSIVIGTICFWRLQKEHYRAEIGYTLHPNYWRKGIMKEAILATINYGFSMMGLHSIEGRINPANAASAATLESTGFIREAYFKEDFYYNNQFYDTAVYSLLKPNTNQ